MNDIIVLVMNTGLIAAVAVGCRACSSPTLELYLIEIIKKSTKINRRIEAMVIHRRNPVSQQPRQGHRQCISYSCETGYVLMLLLELSLIQKISNKGTKQTKN